MSVGADCLRGWRSSCRVLAVAGNTTLQRTEPDGAYRLEYAIDPSIALPTEIRISPARYRSNVSLTVHPPWAAAAVYEPATDPFVVNVLPLREARFGLAVTVTLGAPRPEGALG